MAQEGNHFPGIGEMAAGGFWALPRSLPLTQPEIDAVSDGTADAALQLKVVMLGQLAARRLIDDMQPRSS